MIKNPQPNSYADYIIRREFLYSKFSSPRPSHVSRKNGTWDECGDPDLRFFRIRFFFGFSLFTKVITCRACLARSFANVGFSNPKEEKSMKSYHKKLKSVKDGQFQRQNLGKEGSNSLVVMFFSVQSKDHKIIV